MQDVFLRAANEAALLSALTAAGLMGEDEMGNPVALTASHTHALDIIGVLPGKTGYHANLRTDDNQIISALEDITLNPEPITKLRVWF